MLLFRLNYVSCWSIALILLLLVNQVRSDLLNWALISFWTFESTSRPPCSSMWMKLLCHCLHLRLYNAWTTNKEARWWILFLLSTTSDKLVVRMIVYSDWSIGSLLLKLLLIAIHLIVNWNFSTTLLHFLLELVTSI